MKLPTRNGLLIAIFLGLVVATTASFVSPVNSVVDVTILSATGYLDSSGYYHVIGEVQNTGDQAIGNVGIEGTFYGTQGYIDYYITEKTTKTELDILPVGRRSPFEIVLFNTTQSVQVDYYLLDLCLPCMRALETPPMGLEILSDSSYVDDAGMHITGEIKNTGSEKATLVKVIATYYNETGGVVDTEFNHSDPRDMEPGQKAPFEIGLLSERLPYVDRYVLTAESIPYAISAEVDGTKGAGGGGGFPTWTLIPLLVIVIVVALVIYRRRKKRRKRRRLP